MEDSPEFRQKLDKLCEDLLSNPVIEDYAYEIEAPTSVIHKVGFDESYPLRQSRRGAWFCTAS